MTSWFHFHEQEPKNGQRITLTIFMDRDLTGTFIDEGDVIEFRPDDGSEPIDHDDLLQNPALYAWEPIEEAKA